MVKQEIKLVEKKEDKNCRELRYQNTLTEAQQLANKMGGKVEDAKKIIRSEKKQINP